MPEEGAQKNKKQLCNFIRQNGTFVFYRNSLPGLILSSVRTIFEAGGPSLCETESEKSVVSQHESRLRIVYPRSLRPHTSLRFNFFSTSAFQQTNPVTFTDVNRKIGVFCQKGTVNGA